ncbi:insulinase family protein [Patescibacteria group bacterium]|nr:insulinase family protein [Patescibacteria group bacterium]MBU4115896.1 insulinase family protein [Patescibacteria group bacterium]
MNKPIKKVLKNGMRIVIIPMKESPTVTTLVLVEAGSKYETKEINGISHFLEHMMFKGTKKRKSLEISRELDALGSMSNAFTWHEYTGYYAKARNKNFNKITDVISDIYLNSELPEKEIEKERGVINAEIDMYEDLPQKNVHMLLEKLMYGDQTAGWSILGTKENIKKIKREDFIKYRKKHYVAKKTAVVVAGNINPRNILKEIEERFSQINTHKGGKKKKTIEKQNRPQLLIKEKKTEQLHLAFGFRAFDDKNKKLPIVKLLATILGNGMSSRLFEKLREEMGVAYYVHSYNYSQSDIGNFRIFAGVDPKRIEEVLKMIISELKKIKNEIVSEKEIKKAKEYLIGNMNMGLESSDSVAEWYGEQEIMHLKLETPEEETNKIKKVTAENIKNIANEIFLNNKMNLAIIGPIKKNKNLLKYMKV